ncbi:MAG: DUF2200 domain-containing protein [Tessaracoccus sp.]|nr:DUF2200 domain-containing protein [Tessaracoccus sp.]MBK7820999.1 DUF2200 domain-containing protein [Tessaracoccus sp.]
MPFASIYPLYIEKVERKGRTCEELDQVLTWLTGYDKAGLQKAIDDEETLESFFAEAPAINPNVSLITGVICGYRVEEIEDPLMQRIRYMDKLVDELARGKKMASILREPAAG